MTSIGQIIRDAAPRIDSDSARLDCQLLLAHLLQQNRSWVIAHDDDELAPELAEQFQQLIEQRSDGVPVAYLIGEQDFWQHRFIVSPDVLIPRPDTELLVQTIIDRHPERPIRLADLGTGSGAIAISLGLAFPDDEIIALDQSCAAIRIAEQNRQRLGAKNVSCQVGDWLEGFEPESLAMVVSNPPYIVAQDEHLAALRHEPLAALVAGSDGLDDIRIIARQAFYVLESGGLLALEHGYDQQAEVMALLEQAGFQTIEGLRDLGGQPRVSLGVRP